MLPEEALIKATASFFSGAIGVFVLASSRRRAANLFLAAFMFLLAGNQFAETMRTLQQTTAGRVFWFQIASIFAFLDPLALYYFGSVFPERNRLNSPVRVGAVLAFCTALILSVGLLTQPWWASPGPAILLSIWAVGTVVIYGVVLREALRQVRADPTDSAYAELVPALCVITVPAALRAVHTLFIAASPAGPGLDSVHILFGSGLVLAVTIGLLLQARKLPDHAMPARRLLSLGAVAGLAFALVSKPVMASPLSVIHLDFTTYFPDSFTGAGDALKLITFGVLASAAVLRNRMLDLSLQTRRWAARLLAGTLVIGSLGAIALLGPDLLGGDSLLGQPAIVGLLVVVLVLTQGFRRLVDVIAEKAYGVPRGSRRQDRIETYRSAVQQAVEENRVLGSDPQLRRLRAELELDDRTAHVLERMAGPSSGGPLRPGETIDGRYRIETFVGRGSSGRVFRAHDELLDRDVAIKELLHGGPHESARALEEARVAGRLDHPNIVTLHDVVTRPGASLLVTEFVEGPSLDGAIEDEGPLVVDEVLDTLDSILSGLEAVHAEDVVHGDLKPANVVLGQAGTPKITDFGTARSADGGTWHATDDTRPPEGTPAYMAPEQKDGEAANQTSDLYAVATLAEEIAEQPLPDPIQRVLETARAPDPDDRFSSATEMREALREAQRAGVRTGR